MIAGRLSAAVEAAVSYEDPKVFMTGFELEGRRRFWRFVGIWAAIGVAVWIVVAVAWGVRTNLRFEKCGVETSGVVTRVYTRTEYRTERVTRRTSRRVPATVHYLDYRFSVGGRSFEASQRLGRHSVRVRKGDSVVVLYLPDEPERSRLARDSGKNFRIRRVASRRRR